MGHNICACFFLYNCSSKNFSCR